MAADQYCLKWNNHQSTLLVQFETLLESDSLTDCTLSAEGKYLNVHKVLLSACSPYFSKLLGEHKDKHPIFFMKDVAFEELKGIVEYMYKGEVNVMQERLDSFLKTASSLQIKGLADQDGGKGDEREEDPGGGRGKRKQAPDLRGGGGYGDSSPMPEEPPRSPKRRRRPRPVSQDDSLPAHDQNHCDTTTAPPSSAAYQQDVVMPTPLVPVKKTEPVDNSMVHLKTEIPDDVPQVDVQDLTLDDDEDFNNEDITQPGTSFSETSQDFAQWQQQMATQSGADESFIAATQGINQSAGSQGYMCPRCGKVYKNKKSLYPHLRYECGIAPKHKCPYCDYRTKRRANLSSHINYRHSEDARVFACRFCSFSTKHRQKLRYHLIRMHDFNNDADVSSALSSSFQIVEPTLKEEPQSDEPLPEKSTEPKVAEKGRIFLTDLKKLTKTEQPTLVGVKPKKSVLISVLKKPFGESSNQAQSPKVNLGKTMIGRLAVWKNSKIVLVSPKLDDNKHQSRPKIEPESLDSVNTLDKNDPETEDSSKTDNGACYDSSSNTSDNSDDEDDPGPYEDKMAALCQYKVEVLNNKK